MTKVAFTNPLFQPAMRQIIAITQAKDALVTTFQPHLYVSGTIVRFYIPDNYHGPSYGMPQINHMTSEITIVSPTTFTVEINTLAFEPFILPANPTQYAQVVPIAENNAQLNAAEHNKFG